MLKESEEGDTAKCKTSLQTIIVSNKNRLSSIELLLVH